MELSSPELILALISAFRNPARVQQRHGEQLAVRPAAKPVRRSPREEGGAKLTTKGRETGCRCGDCRRCLDNARWERIFTEKFADPAYYTRSVIRTASPLTSI
jgi:hypothetical protein